MLLTTYVPSTDSLTEQVHSQHVLNEQMVQFEKK